MLAGAAVLLVAVAALVILRSPAATVGARAAGGAPATATTREAPQPLAAHRELEAWARRWLGAVQRGESLDEYYAPGVSFQSMARPQRAPFIEGRWRERIGAGRFVVDVERSTAYADDGRSAPAACADVPDASPGVYVLRLAAVEEGLPLGTRASQHESCFRVAGPYLLRVRMVRGAPRICHETWHRDEALCASCPTAWACRAR